MRAQSDDSSPAAEAERDGNGGAIASSRPILLPVSVLFGATLLAQLLSLALGSTNDELEFAGAVLPSVILLSAITLPMAGLGIALGRQIGLGAPVIEGLLYGEEGAWQRLKRDAGLAILLGLAFGTILLLVRVLSAPYLPPELPAFGHRGVLGGLAVSLGAAVGEEVWFRLGLMTLLVWPFVRSKGEARPGVAWPVIVLTSIAFGAAHLPQLMSYGAGAPFAIGGTVAGNMAVGILFGWCYWRRSLVAAMIAHFGVDVVIHALPALI